MFLYTGKVTGNVCMYPKVDRCLYVPEILLDVNTNYWEVHSLLELNLDHLYLANISILTVTSHFGGLQFEVAS